MTSAKKKPAATSSDVSRNTTRPATSQPNMSSNEHSGKNAAPTASVDTDDTSNNEHASNAVENRRLRDEQQTAWIKFRAQSLTNDFLGQITTKLDELAEINPFMRQVPTYLTNVSPAQRAMFNRHLLGSVGPVFDLSDPDMVMVLSSRALQNNLALKNMVVEMLADVKRVSLADFPSLGRFSPDQLKANSVMSTVFGVLAKHARQVERGP